jgi:benzoyl-CoA reductase/2-hydroxyglutaryl-CoA dehydratase subunit BcrC/BadD/HgdB
MNTVACVSPFVPPEWIAAHGWQPRWLALDPARGRPGGGMRRGVCPYAGALVDRAQSGLDAAAVVLTTACDQMRYAAAVMELGGCVPIFLFNLPSTWQSDAARQLYLDELRRLGRFLVALGGQAPSPKRLRSLMRTYDAARAAALAARTRLSARQFAARLVEVRGSALALAGEQEETDAGPPVGATAGLSGTAGRIPLALVGGPLPEKDYALLDWVEQAGACIALDGSEGGERTLPAAFDRRRVQEDPLAALAEAYFGGIPDVFQRPNHRLFEWLGQQMAARGVRGLLLRRYVWCDLWHAEVQRLRQWSPVPLLDLDVDYDGQGTPERTLGRLEAFLEMLR